MSDTATYLELVSVLLQVTAAGGPENIAKLVDLKN